MAKIKINGDSSGYVEIAAPNAAYNNTLELGPGTKILTDKNTHISNIGIGTANPRYPLEVNSGNLLVSGSSAGNIILEDRGVGDSSRPFHVVSSDGGKFVINRSNRNASGTTTSSVNSLTLSSSGNLGLGAQTSPAANIHIADLSANGYELKVTGNALQFNRSSNSYIDQLHNTGSILFRMTSSNTEAMRITSSGKIGINDTNPERAVDIRADNCMVQLEGTGGGGRQYSLCSTDNTTGAAVGSAGSFVIYDDTSSSARLSITSDGDMGLGTNSPNTYNNYNTLTINGTTGGEIDFEANGTLIGDIFGNASGLFMQTRTQDPIVFSTYNGSSLIERLRIASNGQVSISSDGTTDGLLTIKGNSDQVGTPSIRLLDGSDTREVSISNTSGDFVASVHGNDNAIHGHIKMFESGIFTVSNGGASGSNTERLRITSTGGVTIGSGNNDASMAEFGSNTGGLTIDDAGVSNTGLRLSHGNDDSYLVQSSNGNFYISQYGTGNMIFGVGSSGNERLRISSSTITCATGVGMAIDGGTSSQPTDSSLLVTKQNNNDWALQVRNYEGTSNDYGFYSRTKGSASYAIGVYDADNSVWRFRVNGVGSIHATNTTVQSISDQRLKENIVDANSQWDDIKALRFRNFNWKEESGYSDGKTYLGLIAQEVEPISPNLIEINAQTKEDIENEVPDPEYKNVKYSIVWMKAVKALQEAQTRIETLETQLTDALARITALEG